ncbi:MAG: hypothetical protein J6386_07940 [Candidatus Synoicihabitans palmerolidicus]|nr:hypothetical protein [Candidatus Synoicihabitans palmerolidicus]
MTVTRDPRVKALVLMAPATPWYRAPGALADITVPILMLSGEHDEITPLRFAHIVRDGLPQTTPLIHHLIPGAGHYSFLAPFPSVMRRPDFPPGNDPAGFDRASFHRKLPADILAFLTVHL